jgi:8-oxo-dGTP pyrophosphatase MutT (NUDIX family)
MTGAATPLAERKDLRTAGTTLVVRDTGNVEVLMLLRHRSMRFFGGFWVFPGGAVDAAENAAARDDKLASIDTAAAAACREMREEAGLTVPTDALLPWARWITPTAVRRRFDTYFFLAKSPPDQQAHVADSESTELRWVDPGIWSTASLSGNFPLTPPTVMVLREFWTALQIHGSFDALLDRERQRIIRPVLPKLLDGGIVVMPWDAQYDSERGEGITWERTAIVERSGWPSRVTAAVHPD